MKIFKKKITFVLDELYQFMDIAKKKENDSVVNWREYKLENIKILLDRLGNPENFFQSIHIAGTKGKGSVTHYLSAMLTESNIANGCFFSPHIMDERDRFYYNSKKSSWQEIIPLLEKCIFVSKKFNISNTVFDLFTATAFLYFKEKEVKIAIIETGLGGRLDSTNVLPSKHSIAAVITQIGKDHTNILGDCILKIAEEKAGIIKKNTSLFYQAQQDKYQFQEIEEILCKIFKKKNSHLKTDKFLFKINDDKKLFHDDIYIPKFQKLNLTTSVKILEKLNFLFEKNKVTFIKKIFKNYPLEGRYQKFEENIILDGAHNETSIKALIKTIKEDFNNQKFERVDVYFYLLPEKDVELFLLPIPQNWNLYLWNIDIYYLDEVKKKKQINRIKEKYKKINKKNLVTKNKNFFLKSKKNTLSIVTGSFTLITHFLKSQKKN